MKKENLFLKLQDLDYVDSSIAKVIKEKGFSDKTEYFYANSNYGINDVYHINDVGIKSIDDVDTSVYQNVYSAPDYLTTLKWFYDRGFFITLILGDEVNTFKVRIYRTINNVELYTSHNFTSQKEALNDGIYECVNEMDRKLDELIDFNTAKSLYKSIPDLKSDYSWIISDNNPKLLENGLIKGNVNKYPAITKNDLNFILENNYDTFIRYSLTSNHKFQFKLGRKDKRKKETIIGIFDSYAEGIKFTYESIISNLDGLHDREDEILEEKQNKTNAETPKKGVNRKKQLTSAIGEISKPKRKYTKRKNKNTVEKENVAEVTN